MVRLRQYRDYRLNLSQPAQWAIWGAGLLAAFVFAWVFHHAIDEPLQARIRSWLKNRAVRRGRIAKVIQPIVSLEG